MGSPAAAVLVPVAVPAAVVASTEECWAAAVLAGVAAVAVGDALQGDVLQGVVLEGVAAGVAGAVGTQPSVGQQQGPIPQPAAGLAVVAVVVEAVAKLVVARLQVGPSGCRMQLQ